MNETLPETLNSPPGAAPRVRVLPPHLVNQIAAGEVVERPSSVVKELVENAIDAGASTIEVELENGGKKLIEVRDDGCGMSAADAELAMQRHATSKIAVFDDLLSVRTLGFRGEALPSIASVSRFVMTTYDGKSEAGTEIVAEGGEFSSRPASRARGTTIRVAELFENVPARRKFLRSADAEFRVIVQVLSAYALALHDKTFVLAHNGRVVLELLATDTPRHRAIQVLGPESKDALQPIEYSIGEINASGFVTRDLRYGSRRNQYFFVNRRLVRDKVLTHAATRAGDAFDFEGHPGIVLFIDMPPELVDVNVHPAKTEVRFRDSGTVHVVVERGVRDALAGPTAGGGLLNVAESREPSEGSFLPDTPLQHTALQSAFAAPVQSYQPSTDFTSATPLFRQSNALVQPPMPERVVDLGDLRGRVIGQYRDSYILVDTPEGLRIVDQHVAHERVLYDRIDARLGALTSAQQLLSPIVYETGVSESAVLESHLEELRGVGFEIEKFSRNSFAISSVPTVLRREGVESFLRKLIDASLDEKQSPLTRIRDRVVASLACQAAIKVHRRMSGEEMSRIVGELLESSNPYACPHGRPIIVDIRHLDIEKHFHRK
jgi:DNA mismatch repair protein MutL